jgi:hypothetical protein
MAMMTWMKNGVLKKLFLLAGLLLSSVPALAVSEHGLVLSLKNKKNELILKNNTRLAFTYTRNIYVGVPLDDGSVELFIWSEGKKTERKCAYVDYREIPKKLILKPGGRAKMSLNIPMLEDLACFPKGHKYQLSFGIKSKENIVSNRIDLVAGDNGSQNIYIEKR